MKYDKEKRCLYFLGFFGDTRHSIIKKPLNLYFTLQFYTLYTLLSIDKVMLVFVIQSVTYTVCVT